MYRKLPVGILMFLTVSLLAACGGQPQTVQVAPPLMTDSMLRESENLKVPEKTRREEAYLIGLNDELEIKFLDHAYLNESIKVRPDGYISLQMIGAVRAEGRTPGDLQEELINRYRNFSSQGSGEKEYLIRPNDELDVKFPYRPTANESVKVRPDGKISLPLANTVVAEGKTPEQLSSELRKLYAKYFRVPEVVVMVRSALGQTYRQGGRELRLASESIVPTVIVRAYAPPQVFVGGEVARPGVMAYRRTLTLMQAVIEAGGHKPTADMHSVVVLRKSNAAEPLIIHRDLWTDVTDGTTNDIVLEPFDVVVLPKTGVATLAEILEQFVFNLLPPLKNSAFSFLYQVNRTTARVTQ